MSVSNGPSVLLKAHIAQEHDSRLWWAMPHLLAVVEAAEATVLNAQLVCDEEILLDRSLVALARHLEDD